MAFKVLGIEAFSINDLLRLHVNLKKNRLGLFSYRFGSEPDVFHIGFYFPPLVKAITAVYVYATLKCKPSSIYSIGIGDKEDVREEYVESSTYANIPVASISGPPHQFIKPSEIEVSYDVTEVDDLISFATIAYSTYLESAIIPFIWYDESRGEYVLNVEASSDNEEAIAIFTLKYSEPKSGYLEVDYKSNDVKWVKKPKDVSKKYILVIKARQLPFFSFKKKST